MVSRALPKLKRTPLSDSVWGLFLCSSCKDLKWCGLQGSVHTTASFIHRNRHLSSISAPRCPKVQQRASYTYPRNVRSTQHWKENSNGSVLMQIKVSQQLMPTLPIKNGKCTNRNSGHLHIRIIQRQYTDMAKGDREHTAHNENGMRD